MNVSHQFAGSSNTPLHPLGKDQAKAAGKWARDNGIVFDVVLASPMDRTVETARHIATEVGYDHDRILLPDDLRARHFGVLAGQESHKSPVDRQEYMENAFAMDHIEDIETITDLQFRANKTLEYLCSLPQDVILVVSHGAYGRALYRAAKNLPISDFGRTLGNAEIIRFI